MAKIAFIGLGNMGGPMAANLAKAQHQVFAFDLSATAVDTAVEKGAKKAPSAAEAVKGAEVVVTMLPAGRHVREVYEKDVLPNVAKGDRKSTRLNSSHQIISYAVFCLKKKKKSRNIKTGRVRAATGHL